MSEPQSRLSTFRIGLQPQEGETAMGVNMRITDLQNGSDIRGIAIATPEDTITLTPEVAQAVGRGLVNWLVAEKQLGPQLEQEKLTVAVGQDSRLSGDALK